MDDKKCLLVEFKNFTKKGKPLVDVGFLKWTKYGEFEPLKKIINEKIMIDIDWPVDKKNNKIVQSKPSKQMVYELMNTEIVLKPFEVRVLKYGCKYKY